MATTLPLNGLKALLPGQTSAQHLADALNVSVINFASADANIPEESTEVLTTAGKLLSEIKDARLFIIGHTDNSGRRNKKCGTLGSTAPKPLKFFYSRMAQAMNNSPQPAWVQPNQKPTNNTEAGRFANRRIEFVVNDGINTP